MSDKSARLRVSQKIAGIVATVAFIATATIPSIEPAIIKNISNYNLRVVAGNIYEGLSGPLYNLYFTLTAISIALIISIFIFQKYVEWVSNRS